MKRFELVLSIEVEAEDAGAAFAMVRSNYCVVNDPTSKITEGLVDFLMDDPIHEIKGGE